MEREHSLLSLGLPLAARADAIEPQTLWELTQGARLIVLAEVEAVGSPSASLTSRSAPARYAQEGSCPSHALTPSWPLLSRAGDFGR